MPWYLFAVIALSVATFTVSSLASIEDLQNGRCKRAVCHFITAIMGAALCVGSIVLYSENPDWMYKDTMSEYTKAKEALERFYEEYPEYKEE